MLTLKMFHTFFYCFCCWLWADKCLLGSTLLQVNNNKVIHWLTLSMGGSSWRFCCGGLWKTRMEGWKFSSNISQYHPVFFSKIIISRSHLIPIIFKILLYYDSCVTGKKSYISLLLKGCYILESDIHLMFPKALTWVVNFIATAKFHSKNDLYYCDLCSSNLSLSSKIKRKDH